MRIWIVRSGNDTPLIVRANTAIEALEKVAGKWFDAGIRRVAVEEAIDTDAA